jgi:hypothetical protein
MFLAATPEDRAVHRSGERMGIALHILTCACNGCNVEGIWTCDSIIGFMFSTSIASRWVLGDRAGNFEANRRAALLEYEPRDRFVSMQRFGFTLGRKVGDDG